MPPYMQVDKSTCHSLLAEDTRLLDQSQRAKGQPVRLPASKLQSPQGFATLHVLWSLFQKRNPGLQEPESLLTGSVRD